jgi:hypothetical protein
MLPPGGQNFFPNLNVVVDICGSCVYQFEIIGLLGSVPFLHCCSEKYVWPDEIFIQSFTSYN